MNAYLTLSNIQYEVPSGISIIQALELIDVEPDMVLAIRNGCVLQGSSILIDHDQIQLIYVISGG